MFSDMIVSFIRTVVPAAVGALIVWVAARSGIVVDEQTQAGVMAFAVAIVTSAYYAVVRFLEARWPTFGWFLGAPKQPVYVDKRETALRP